MFKDRRHAGRLLGDVLIEMAQDEPVIMALPRGGVPVGAEVARTLQAPLDVLVVNRLMHPTQPDLGLGAIAEGGFQVLDEALTLRLGLSTPVLDRITLDQARDMERRVRRYRRGQAPLTIRDRVVIVIDDGVATGSTALAGIGALRVRGAARIVFAVPVSPPDVAPALRAAADDFVCLEEPQWFFSVSEFYERFPTVSEDEVAAILDAHSTVEPADGVVTLTGSVRTEGDLPVVEGLARHVPGVVAVDNRVTAREEGY